MSEEESEASNPLFKEESHSSSSILRYSSDKDSISASPVLHHSLKDEINSPFLKSSQISSILNPSESFISQKDDFNRLAPDSGSEYVPDSESDSPDLIPFQKKEDSEVDELNLSSSEKDYEKDKDYKRVYKMLESRSKNISKRLLSLLKTGGTGKRYRAIGAKYTAWPVKRKNSGSDVEYDYVDDLLSSTDEAIFLNERENNSDQPQFIMNEVSEFSLNINSSSESRFKKHVKDLILSRYHQTSNSIKLTPEGLNNLSNEVIDLSKQFLNEFQKLQALKLDPTKRKRKRVFHLHELTNFNEVLDTAKKIGLPDRLIGRIKKSVNKQ